MVTQKKLKELFQLYGNVTSAVVQTDEEGNSKCFGFVNYEKHEEAQYAIDSLHNACVGGRRLYVQRAQTKSERLHRAFSLYIGNLEGDIDDEKLRAEFEPFGTIVSCKVMTNGKGISKGFGFVTFSQPGEAIKAVVEMNNKKIGAKQLYVSFVRSREARGQFQPIAQGNRFRGGVARHSPGHPFGRDQTQTTSMPPCPSLQAHNKLGYNAPHGPAFDTATVPLNEHLAVQAALPPKNVPHHGRPQIPLPSAYDDRLPTDQAMKYHDSIGSPATLAAISSMEQRKIISELYWRISESLSEFAAKIISVPDKDYTELLNIRESEKGMVSKLNEVSAPLCDISVKETNSEGI
ncbi:hypothetical protein HGRIS_001172 [Hohenbuehelia grisea]|uniref:RRM domain-containing protein n=1 Tax=Hohenbuehelia grisea TaxID=104357 RepID=A0ABR3JQD9_9AGAR